MKQLRHLLLFALFCCIAITATAQATWLKIASGGYQTLALKSDGTVWTWGYNNYGQLGNGTTTNSNVPIQVPGLSQIVDVGAGLSFSLAVDASGNVYAWGRNNFGQLGNGTYNNSSVPVQVSGLTGVIAVGAGQGHCLALKSNGTVYSWGYNISGQLGNGTYNDNITPTQISSLSNITKIDVGYNHSAALTSNGTLYVWGYNGYGQLGNGTYNDNPTPTVLTLASGVTTTAISIRGFHAMALGSNGSLYTWGRNDYGQLGNGSTTQSNTPGVVTLAAGVTPVSIMGYYYHSMAVGSDGNLYSWGRNDNGQLGNGTTTQANLPVLSNTGNHTIVGMAMGIYHSAILVSGRNEIYLTGVNSEGEQGDGTNTMHTVYTLSLACAQVNALPGNNSTFTANAPSVGNTVAMLSGCTTIAAVSPAGASPVTGSITAKGYLSSSAPSFNGNPYVRRYYNITPAANANTATANITLYFTQSDFDDYNANRGSMPALPLDITDAANNKANLRITQEHGTSSSGAPGTFTGWSGSGLPNELITPTSVTYNSAAARWEVTFPVTGFSGFFAHTTVTNIALAVKLVSFEARKKNNRNQLNWATATEDNGTGFSIERSSNGVDFYEIGSVVGKGQNSSYTFDDAQPLTGTNYYRLRITAPGAEDQHSNVVSIQGDSRSGAVTVSPVPANRSLHITCNDGSLNGQAATIYNIQGQEVYHTTLSADQYVDISNWTTGIYMLKLPNGTVQRIVKQ